MHALVLALICSFTPPEFIPGKNVYVVGNNTLFSETTGLSIEKEVQTYKYPFYVVMVETLPVKSGAETDPFIVQIIDKWKKHNNFNLVQSQVLLLSGTPRTYRLIAGPEFKERFGLRDKALDTHLERFKVKAKQGDVGGGVIALGRSLNEFLTYSTDPVRIAAEIEAARVKKAKDEIRSKEITKLVVSSLAAALATLGCLAAAFFTRRKFNQVWKEKKLLLLKQQTFLEDMRSAAEHMAEIRLGLSEMPFQGLPETTESYKVWHKLNSRLRALEDRHALTMKVYDEKKNVHTVEWYDTLESVSINENTKVLAKDVQKARAIPMEITKKIQKCMAQCIDIAKIFNSNTLRFSEFTGLKARLEALIDRAERCAVSSAADPCNWSDTMSLEKTLEGIENDINGAEEKLRVLIRRKNELDIELGQMRDAITEADHSLARLGRDTIARERMSVAKETYNKYRSVIDKPYGDVNSLHEGMREHTEKLNAVHNIKRAFQNVSEREYEIKAKKQQDERIRIEKAQRKIEEQVRAAAAIERAAQEKARALEAITQSSHSSFNVVNVNTYSSSSNDDSSSYRRRSPEPDTSSSYSSGSSGGGWSDSSSSSSSDSGSSGGDSGGDSGSSGGDF